MSETGGTIILNGESHPLPKACSLGELLVELQLEAEHVAVELNLDIVPRTRFPETLVRAGDRLEIVTFVGGG